MFLLGSHTNDELDAELMRIGLMDKVSRKRMMLAVHQLNYKVTSPYWCRAHNNRSLSDQNCVLLGRSSPCDIRPRVDIFGGF